MNTAVRLGAYAIGLLALFAVATGVGRAVGPVDSPAPEHSDAVEHGEDAAGHGEDAAHEEEAGHSDDGHEEPVAEIPGGLMVSDQGYTLSLTRTTLPSGSSTPVSFRILGPDGEPVTDYDVLHDKALHLIAVRRDLSGYQHVHPELGRDGVWRVPLSLTPGSWRVFADFAPAALEDNLILGADVSVAGNYQRRPLPPAADVTKVDGYTVTLEGELTPGEESELTLSVSRGGEPVTDLEPYLDAYGHLVALRAGDLAYLHVHPAGEPGDGSTQPGPEVTFFTNVPSPGEYRLFLDFKHEGVVRTAALTVRAGSS
ncbi:MAG: FIG00995371: possibly secreted protein [uncultured Quadrisphaera sp.]|uniref:FIG00995371: possibly secreted protein n=1 Tax=uncultured Quadrisphaera sp. TaxID=904978 RepID=A0A6J4PM67_9ACTN|nr:MAG: FIG00995371: possibly secreted protein [uncultured Quadrisphaera sp.]